jgi:ATP-dependent RNA helicase HelY
MTHEELVNEFAAKQPYQLDDSQLDAIRALANRHSVLVAAPTGTGKTVVGEFGIFMARKYNMRAVYTRRSRRSRTRSIEISARSGGTTRSAC